MQAREFKDKIYGELAGITKAMANAHRLEIIELLAQGPCSVEYVAQNTDLSIANASQHLQVLKNAKLLKTEKQGKYSLYSLADPKVFEVWKSLRDLGIDRNAEVEKLINDYRESTDNLESIDARELLNRVKQGEAIVVDVRPEEEFEEGHIQGAVSLPTDKLNERLKHLPKNKEIIAYCRGQLCLMADEAVNKLREKGFKAVKFKEGYPEWKSRGYPVEEG